MKTEFLGNVPQELKDLPQWVAYQAVPKDNGKVDKIPKNPKTGGNAVAEVPGTWGTFNQAILAVKKYRLDGIGFEFSKDDEYCGIDLDDCLDAEMGELSAWAIEHVDLFNSYTEITPSGKGLHIIVKGKLPPGGRKKGDIEVYDSARFFTVTGNLLNGNRVIRGCQRELEEFHRRVFQEPKQQSKPAPTKLVEASDDDLIQKAKNAANGQKFSQLWSGDWQGAGYESQSQGDFSLCAHLAFWTGNDAGRIDKLFRQSGLYRKKWDREDYSSRTINRAIAGTTEVYTPPNSANSANSARHPHAQQVSAKLSNAQQALSNAQQESALTLEDFQENLTGHIREWIKDSTGCFTTGDLDREFDLRTRAQKNLRARVLSMLLYKEKIISKDRSIRGKYHILDDCLSFVDFDHSETARYPLTLPFGLATMVNIPPKSVIVVAGTTNAGKTAVLLNIAALNLTDHSGELLYLFSEMGAGEFKARLKSLDSVPFGAWKGMRAAERSVGFFAAIKRHNADGISFVDYLEDVNGEYFKIASGIREVYDALGEGVAIIALQKASQCVYGRGGEATTEKARLYLSLDKLLEVESGIICALRIVKAKDYSGRNPNGMEVHLHIARHGINELGDWQRLNQKQRESLVEQYAAGFSPRKRGM